MQLVFKATNIKNPGKRGARYWYDVHGNVRYGERPVNERAPYLARITFTDGTVGEVHPTDKEIKDGQVEDQKAVRRIINRELLGEYGFKSDGTFWKHKGLLFDYELRRDKNGRIVKNRNGDPIVDEIQLHEGYTNFEFRDASVSRAYGIALNLPPEEGLPTKIAKYKLDKPIETAVVPEKSYIEHEGTPDHVDPLQAEDLTLLHRPNRTPQTQVAIGEPLDESEDPILIASAYLAEYMHSRKPSQAKTPEGQAKAREERIHQFDPIVGKRKIESLPAWAINKFDSPEELQLLLGRHTDLEWTETFKDASGKLQTKVRHADGGKPLSTLITLGLGGPNLQKKRFREQLLKEMGGFIRKMARRYAGVFQSTTTMRELGGDARVGSRWLREREKDLYSQGVLELMQAADTYVANDEPTGPDSRFDRFARNKIQNAIRKMAKQQAIELHGATALEDFREADAYHAPKMISPKDAFELRHYGPRAVRIINDALADLDDAERKVFMSRLFLDEVDAHPDVSDERRVLEARARVVEEGHGERVQGDVQRPWTRQSDQGITSVADKIADTYVGRAGKLQRFGDLPDNVQRHHLNTMFESAKAKLEERLKTKTGGLTPEGAIVERYLRAQARLASVNVKDLRGRMKMPIVTGIKPASPRVEHLRPYEHPAVTFFRNNHELAERLGVADQLDAPLSLRNIKQPTSVQHKLGKYGEGGTLGSYHQLHQNLQNVANLAPVYRQAKIETERAANMGHWHRDGHGNVEWSESKSGGVVALHEAAVKLSHNPTDKHAIEQFTKAQATLGDDHPMVHTYRIALEAGKHPSNEELAHWKSVASNAYRDAMNRLHVVEFVQQDRSTKKSVGDLRKALAMCVQSYDELCKVVA